MLADQGLGEGVWVPLPVEAIIVEEGEATGEEVSRSSAA